MHQDFILWAAAIAYHEAGLSQTKEEYDQLAYTELHRAYVSLKDVAVKEEHPVKINWNC